MKRTENSITGFSLVEVTLALGVAAFALIAIFGLLVTGTQTNHTAVEQTASSDILTAVAADLRATAKTSPSGSATPSQQFRVSIPANPVASPTPTPTTLFFSSQGQCSTSLDGSTQPDGTSWNPPLQIRYRLTITFLAPSPTPAATPARTATFVDLKVTWPARASVSGANTGAAETFVALDRN
jgi:uncharacterized protein (TIGR02598 family)